MNIYPRAYKPCQITLGRAADNVSYMNIVGVHAPRPKFQACGALSQAYACSNGPATTRLCSGLHKKPDASSRTPPTKNSYLSFRNALTAISRDLTPHTTMTGGGGTHAPFTYQLSSIPIPSNIPKTSILVPMHAPATAPLNGHVVLAKQLPHHTPLHNRPSSLYSAHRISHGRKSAIRAP